MANSLSVESEFGITFMTQNDFKYCNSLLNHFFINRSSVSRYHKCYLSKIPIIFHSIRF